MTGWHADETLLSDYTNGLTDYVLSGSIETHLMGCATCRSMLRHAVDSRRIDRLLAGTVDRIDAPRRGLIERALARLGVRPHTARLLVATPMLRASWLAAVAVVLAFATIAARADPRGVIIFLTLAPLAPVAGVATAFGSFVDPSHEIGAAAPFSAFRLLMIRATAVLATTAVGAGVTAALVPGADAAWAWLLPALALTGVTLAASERVDPTLAAAVISGAWVLSVVALRVESLPVFGGAGQVVFLLVAVAAAAVVHNNRDRINLIRGAQ
jgi:hypothetical protein